tara:strand:+ start:1091 stop:1531 length:441 start_codon:yes stop_codon:yes gene_type:complete
MMTGKRPIFYIVVALLIFSWVYISMGGFEHEHAVVPYEEYLVIEEYKTFRNVELDEGVYVGSLEHEGFTYIASYEFKPGNRLVKRVVMPDQTFEKETKYCWEGAVLMFESDDERMFPPQGLPIIKASENTFRIDADYSINVYSRLE